MQVAGAVVALLEHHQRLLDQRCRAGRARPRRERLAAADLLGRGEVEAADEHAEPVEHCLLRRVEQVVRPVDQRAQRLLALLQHARAAGQQLVAVLAAGH